MAIYGPAPGLQGRTFGLRILNREVFNFRTTHCGEIRGQLTIRAIGILKHKETCEDMLPFRCEQHAGWS